MQISSNMNKWETDHIILKKEQLKEERELVKVPLAQERLTTEAGGQNLPLKKVGKKKKKDQIHGKSFAWKKCLWVWKTII